MGSEGYMTPGLMGPQKKRDERYNKKEHNKKKGKTESEKIIRLKKINRKM